MRNNYVESKYDSTVRLNFSLKIMVRTFYEDTGTRAVGLGTGLGVETDFLYSRLFQTGLGLGLKLSWSRSRSLKFFVLQIIDSLLVDWKLPVLPFFFFTVHFFWNMPIR